MATVESVMAQLRKHGNEQTRKTYVRHGASEDRVYGVKIAELKRIARDLRGEQALAGELYETGNVDAMYLAGLIADGRRMSRRALDRWAARGDVLPMISEYTVPWVASESEFARDRALKWIKSKKEHVAASGWCTYTGIVAVTSDERLDLGEISELIDTAVMTIHAAPNRVRYAMNGFIIAVGAYVRPLLAHAKRAAAKIGVVSVDMGNTACKVPDATAYIDKIESMGRIGKKRPTLRC